MSMRNFPRYRAHPLNSDGTDVPAWAAGGKATFYCRDMPISTRGKYANYVAGFMLTVDATATYSGTTALTYDRTQDQIALALFSDILVENAWCGTLMSNNHVKAYSMDMIERIALGGYFTRRMHPLNGASGAAQTFRASFFIPMTHGRGEKGFHHNAPLACLMRDSKLTINFPAASVLTDGVNSVAISAGTMRCSAILVPDRELRLGPAHEWIEYNRLAPSGDPVTLDGLGSTTGFLRTLPGIWADTMLLLTDANNQKNFTGIAVGSFLASTLTRFNAEWAGQGDTKHVEALMALAEQADEDRGTAQQTRLSTLAATTSGASAYLDDRSGFPYASRSCGAVVTRPQTIDPFALFIPILLCPSGLETTKLPRFEAAQTLNRTVTLVSGTPQDRVLTHQFRAWSPEAYDLAKSLIIGSGLALDVLGETNLGWEPMPGRKNPVTMEDAAILPQRLVPKVAKAA